MATQFCTYVWRDPKTNVIIYVGEGKISRPKAHLKNKGTKLHNVLKKRREEGFNLEPQIIPALSKADAEEMQDLLIAMIGCEFDSSGTLFNLVKTARTTSGRKWSQKEHEARALQRQLPSDIEKRSNALKASMPQAMRNRYEDPEQRALTAAKTKAYWDIPGIKEARRAALAMKRGKV